MKTLTALLLTAAVALAGDTREDADRKLETKVTLDVNGVRLADTIPIFRDATGLNFVVADGADVVVRLTVRDVSAKSALRLLLQPVGLGAGFEHGVVVIRSRETLAGAMTHRVYDLRSALRKLQDFPGPKLELQRGGRLVECTLGCIFCFDDAQLGCPREDFLVMLVRENTGDRSWDSSPQASLALSSGRLYVTQTPRVHREIENLLRQLPF
ncbi:MAG TPA: hypothetical protein VNM14_19180 [Planctomycetota bacterium]|nr:hypothetical protein [Planctomycetota bacterium]